METYILKGELKRSMDEVKIVSGFTKGLISKLLRTVLRKKTGCDVNLQLNDFNIAISDGKTHVHLDLDAELEKDELIKLLKNVGLN